MPVVNSLGTSGEFSTKAREFGLDDVEVANDVRALFEDKAGAPETSTVSIRNDAYRVSVTYNKSGNRELTCQSIQAPPY